MEIRQVKKTDAKSLLALMYRLDSETTFMLFEPGERKTTVEEQQVIIDSFINDDAKEMIVAIDNNEVCGFIVGIGNTTRRNRHSLYCVIGIEQKSTGKGLGKQLLQALEDWSASRDITRLELTVMCHNEHAISLYKSYGFKIEGIKKQALRVDGRFVDEYYMAKLLDDNL